MKYIITILLILILNFSYGQKTVTLYVRDCGDDSTGYEPVATLNIEHCKTDTTYDWCVEIDGVTIGLDSAIKKWKRLGLKYKINNK